MAADLGPRAWLDLACRLRIRRARGKRAPYQPALLLAALVRARKHRRNRMTLEELSGGFWRLMSLLAPASREPDSLAMPYRALVNRGVVVAHTVEGGAARLQAALRTGASPRQVAVLVDYASLPDAVFTALVTDEAWALHAVRRLLEAYRSVFEEHGGPTTEALGELLGLGVVDDDAPLVLDDSAAGLDEAGVEWLLLARWDETPFASEGYERRHVRRQVPTPVSTIDLLAAGEGRRQLVIELKRGDDSDRAVGQLSRYMGWVEEVCADGDPTLVRGAILTDVVGPRLRYAVKGHGRAELWRYDDTRAIERVV